MWDDRDTRISRALEGSGYEPADKRGRFQQGRFAATVRANDRHELRDQLTRMDIDHPVGLLGFSAQCEIDFNAFAEGLEVREGVAGQIMWHNKPK